MNTSSSDLIELIISQYLNYETKEEITANECAYVYQIFSDNGPLHDCTSLDVTLLNKFLTKLNASLNHKSQHIKSFGILLLGSSLEQCRDVSYFSDICVSWLNSLLIIIKHQATPWLSRRATLLFTDIISRCVPYAPLRRDICDSPLSKFVNVQLQYCVSYNNSDLQLAAFKSLRKCMVSTTSAVRNYVAKIETVCLEVISHDIVFENVTLKRNIGKCLVSLPLCGHVGQTQNEVWSIMCKRILGSLHLTLDKALAVIKEEHRYDTSKLPSLTIKNSNSTVSDDDDDEDASVVAVKALQKFSTFCEFFQLLIARGYESTFVDLPIVLIISVTKRVLDVDNNSESHFGKGPEWKSLMCNLSSYYLQSIELLMIVCSHKTYQPFMMEHYPLISRLINRYLALSSTMRALRLPTFRLCLAFLSIHRNGLEIDFLAHVIKEVMHEINLFFDSSATSASNDPNVSLSALEGFKKRGDGRRKHNRNNSKSSSSKSDWNKTKTAPFDDSLFSTGVQILTQLFTFHAKTIGENDLITIQRFVCNQLIQCQTYPRHDVRPYNHSSCRLRLYQLLYSSLITIGAERMQFIQQSIRLFNFGIKDPNPEVSSFCFSCTRVCGLIAHPRTPALPKRELKIKDENDVAYKSSDLFEPESEKKSTELVIEKATSQNTALSNAQASGWGGSAFGTTVTSTDNSSKNDGTNYSANNFASNNSNYKRTKMVMETQETGPLTSNHSKIAKISEKEEVVNTTTTTTTTTTTAAVATIATPQPFQRQPQEQYQQIEHATAFHSKPTVKPSISSLSNTAFLSTAVSSGEPAVASISASEAAPNNSNVVDAGNRNSKNKSDDDDDDDDDDDIPDINDDAPDEF